jgi:transglutaminase-like putative cysteine protease/predicted glutamine amidotransferase
MPNLLAMSFEGELAPYFDLRCLGSESGKAPDGWGIGYYPGGEPSAAITKEAAPHQGSVRAELLKSSESIASSLFVFHVRTATWGSNTDANTQPFDRIYGGRHWLFAHSGSLKNRLVATPGAIFEPIGSTDTERIFCELLNRAHEGGGRSIGDIPHETLRQWLVDLNEHGTLSAVLTDGRDLAVYADEHDRGSMYVWEILPPHGAIAFGDADVEIDLTRRGIKSRKGIVVSSSPLEPTNGCYVNWRKLAPGTLLIVRQGMILAEISTSDIDHGGHALSRPFIARSSQMQLPRRAQNKRLRVTHKTSYQYLNPVERSTHLLRLTPMHDRHQRLIEHSLTMSVDGKKMDYEDVFGNVARRVVIDRAYTSLTIEATSLVDALDTEPLTRATIGQPPSIPYVWMPWQRHLLAPYLLPPELPESQLAELVEYATSFAIRNDYDLVDTLIDLNSSIYREYAYRQGTTSLSTTPFEIYTGRAGVCQDFTNLFICLAQLLGVPARYTCGYIYTGPKNPNQRQSEASHAWVQVYLPNHGWRGFDPTNGILTQTDHVRVAVGRNYVDATPTSGTIYVGGGPESLFVDVRCELA